jgi:hypothetical protein
MVILRGIERDPGRSMSNEMIQRLLNTYGHHCGISEVNAQINWLERRGYVTADRLGDSGLVVAGITRPGIDVATGQVRAEGIDPPPRED